MSILSCLFLSWTASRLGAVVPPHLAGRPAVAERLLLSLVCLAAKRKGCLASLRV